MKNCFFREIFSNPDEFADVLGLARQLINGFATIWTALKVGLPLDPAKFREKCGEIKKIYYDFAPWAHMCPALHKVLDHYHVLLVLLPRTLTVSLLSEEAAEGLLKALFFFKQKNLVNFLAEILF